MKVFLWIIQGLLCAAFCMAGTMKLMQPVEALATQMEWVKHFQPWMVKLIALSEVLGGLGLILPAIIKSLPQKLTVLAGAGLTLLMVGAVGTHAALGELNQSLPAIVLGLLAGYITYQRNTELQSQTVKKTV